MTEIRESLKKELKELRYSFLEIYSSPYRNFFHVHDYKSSYFGTFDNYMKVLFSIFLPETPDNIFNSSSIDDFSSKQLMVFIKQTKHVLDIINKLKSINPRSHVYVKKLKNIHYENDSISSFKLSVNEWMGFEFSIMEVGNCCGMATIYNISNLKSIGKDLFFDILKGANYSYYQYINKKSDSSYMLLEEYGFTEVETFDNRRGQKGLSILKYNLNKTLTFKLTKEEEKLCAA